MNKLITEYLKKYDFLNTFVKSCYSNRIIINFIFKGFWGFGVLGFWERFRN